MPSKSARRNLYLWVDLNDHQASTSYNPQNLTRDTIAALDADATVLVHMETLRRATLYARQAPQAAKELLTRLHARAVNPEARNAALAWFDAGYLAEAYKEWFGKDEANPARGLDGYRLGKPKPSSSVAPTRKWNSPPRSSPSRSRRRFHAAHVQKALAGATSDPLLARNLASDFRHQTISALLSRGASQPFNP